MRFTQTREALRAGIDAVSALVPGNTTLPILGNVLIKSAGLEHVSVTATNLDQAIRILVPAKVSEEGAITAPARKLREVARALPDAEVTVRAKDTAISISAERAQFRLNGLPREEFPALPTLDWTTKVKVPASDLKEMIANVAFCTSTEETRPILNGVLWEHGEKEMWMVATNGHRLSRQVSPLNGGGRLPRPVIVHPKALTLLARLAGDNEVQIAVSENHIGFRAGTVEVLCRLIEGPYPNYEQVLPKDNPHVLVANRTILVAAVRRMAIVASDQTHRLRLGLGPATLKFSVETPDLGEAAEEIPVEYRGEPLDIGFNAEYLLEMLNSIASEKVQMTFKAPERAAVLSPVSEDGAPSRRLSVLMPLRLI